MLDKYLAIQLLPTEPQYSGRVNPFVLHFFVAFTNPQSQRCEKFNYYFVSIIVFF